MVRGLKPRLSRYTALTDTRVREIEYVFIEIRGGEGAQDLAKVVPFCATKFQRNSLQIVDSLLASPTGFEPVLSP